MVVKKLGIAIAATILSGLPAAWGGQWPNWRGPHFNGSAEEQGPPDTWTDSDNVAWMAPPPGPAAPTPAVWVG